MTGLTQRSALAAFLFILLFSCTSKKETATTAEPEVPEETMEAADVAGDSLAVVESSPAGACDVSVYLIDPDTTGTNVRDTPKGNVIRKLKYNPDCLCLIVKVTDAKDGWLHLKEGGWVFANLFEIGSRKGSFDKIYLNEFTTEESDVVSEYEDEAHFNILGCENTWLYVKGKDGKKGWLSMEQQCDNPLTYCN